MRRKFITMTVLLALAMGAFTGYYTQYHLRAPAATSGDDVAIGNQRPDFKLFDFGGQSVSAAAFDNKVVLVNFWASWCPPCRREIPEFSEVREFFKDQGFEVVGIAIDDKKKAQAFLKAMPQVKYPQLIGHNDAVAVAKAFGNRRGSLPYSVIYDRQGIIRFVKRGEIKKDELIELVEDLL